MAEEARAEQPDICGLTRTGPTGIEWICIAAVHDVAYVRKSGDRTHRKGDLIFSNNPKSEQHYWVRRWPNRGGVSEEVDAKADTRATG